VRVIDLFREWDTSGDGLISLREFDEGIHKLGYTADAASVETLFKQWDMDASGYISLFELNKILRHGGTVRLAEHLRFNPEEHARRQEEEKRKLTNKVAKRLHRALHRKTINAQDKHAATPAGAALTSEQEKLLKRLAKQKEKLVTFFEAWDTNGDGFISRSELYKAAPLVGVTSDRATVDALFNTMDYEGAGRLPIDHLHKCLRWACKVSKGDSNIIHIHFDESVPLHEQIRDALTAHAIRVIDLFREFDEDGNGEITQDEFAKALPMLGIPVTRAQAHGIFENFDHDGSGGISFREFNKLLRRDVKATQRHKNKKDEKKEELELLSLPALKKEVMRECSKLTVAEKKPE